MCVSAYNCVASAACASGLVRPWEVLTPDTFLLLMLTLLWSLACMLYLCFKFITMAIWKVERVGEFKKKKNKRMEMSNSLGWDLCYILMLTLLWFLARMLHFCFIFIL